MIRLSSRGMGRPFPVQLLFFATLTALTGCSDGSSEGNVGSINRDIEVRLTLAQGLYGQTTAQDDVGDAPLEYFEMNLEVFEAGSDTALTKVRSGDQGFYEVPLDPGEYRVCTTFGRCADFVLEADQCVRLDYEFSSGPGWSTATAMACPEPTEK